MKALRVLPLVLLLAACSSVKNPFSPYRIDVQQGNALEQEAVEKLKPGLTHSQVRFVLGTPPLVDPFHGDRWDYVFNFRKAGKLTEERRLVLFFEGDVLKRIEAEGLAPRETSPESNPAPKPVESGAAARSDSAPVMKPVPAKSESTSATSLGETSIVSPLGSGETPSSSQDKGKTPAVSETSPEQLKLQTDVNVEAIKKAE